MGTPGREPTVSDKEILNIFYESTDPVLSTREVADAISLGRRGTYDRLNQLADDELLEMKKLDNRHTVWWSPRALKSQFKGEE